MGNYLWLFIGAKRSFFVKNIFIIISSMNNEKTKNSRFFDLKILGYKKFKVLKIYLVY